MELPHTNQNTGIDFVKNDVFDVVSIAEGTVKEMKEHEGLIKDDHLTKEEKKRRKEQNNVKAVIFTVLAGIIVLIIYFLVKALTKI